MIVCLDTNVFVSGVLWEGIPSRILKQWIDGVFEVITSPEILAEYELVLHRFEKKLPWEKLFEWVIFAKSHSRLVPQSKWLEIPCRDENDKKFLACALEGHADFLVTGDKDLLAIKAGLPFEIVRPTLFIQRLK